MSPACAMAGYIKTFCTASLPLGPDPQEGLRSAIKTCSSGTSSLVALHQQALKCWQRTAAVGDTLPSQLSRQQSRKKRSSGKRRELAGAREQSHRQPPRTTKSSKCSHCNRVCRSRICLDLKPQQTLQFYTASDLRVQFHYLSTQTDANNVDKTQVKLFQRRVSLKLAPICTNPVIYDAKENGQ